MPAPPVTGAPTKPTRGDAKIPRHQQPAALVAKDGIIIDERSTIQRKTSAASKLYFTLRKIKSIIAKDNLHVTLFMLFHRDMSIVGRRHSANMEVEIRWFSLLLGDLLAALRSTGRPSSMK